MVPAAASDRDGSSRGSVNLTARKDERTGCGGAGLYESTRCVDCKNAVIDEEHLEVWRGIHEQFLEMLELDDLGPVANERIRRDLALSAKVIADFGVPLGPLDKCQV